MIKRLKTIGNSNALILDRALMELIGLVENGEVQLTVHAGALIVTPANPRPTDMRRFESALERVATERREALKKLAE